MVYEDFCGYIGKMNLGDLQWMIVGWGILYVEMFCLEELVYGL